MTTIKNVTDEKETKKKLKRLIGFFSANKISYYNGGGWRGRKIRRKNIQKNLQTSQKIRIIHIFLESLLSVSFPVLGITVHLTSLGCPPTWY